VQVGALDEDHERLDETQDLGVASASLTKSRFRKRRLPLPIDGFLAGLLTFGASFAPTRSMAAACRRASSRALVERVRGGRAALWAASPPPFVHEPLGRVLRVSRAALPESARRAARPPRGLVVQPFSPISDSPFESGVITVPLLEVVQRYRP